MSKIKQATKKTGRARKEQIVAELVEKFNSSSGLVFADYKGLTHHQLEGLKKDLKKLNATILIAKNSLIKLSLGKSQKYADFKDNEGLNLPTATVFIQGDMVEPLKRVQRAIKDFGLPKIKFGVLEGNLTDEEGVLQIASLPNRETLLAQLVSTLNSPIQGLVVSLNANIQKFVMTLDAVAKIKPQPTEQPQSTRPDQTTIQPDQVTPEEVTVQTEQPQSPQSSIKKPAASNAAAAITEPTDSASEASTAKGAKSAETQRNESETNN